MANHWQRCAQDAWQTIDRLRAEIAALRDMQAKMMHKMGIMSEVLRQAAERGKVCGKCLRELTEEVSSAQACQTPSPPGGQSEARP